VFLKKTKYTASGSLTALAWRKFRKDKLGFGSLVFIGFVLLTAIAGYLVTPDSTPYANDQHLELGLKKPGFSVLMLNVKNQNDPPSPGILSVMLWGKPGTRESIPISSWRTDHDTLFAKPYPPALTDVDPEFAYPLSIVDLPEKIIFWLGTDRFGRDYLSQLVIGTRVSLAVGFISVFISLVIGITLGAVAGYYRGRTDNVILWFINVIWSIPTLLLVIAITFALGKGFWQVFIAVGLTMWVEVARVVRGQVLSIREKEFVEAGKALGFSDTRIIFRHILPNVMAAVIVISAANFASAILIEAGLSFLGIGVQPPVPSWGSMIKENYGYIVLNYAWLAILPGIAIMLMVLAFMFVGNALRDALDVRVSEF
jgi:peptide/nickel transport system permease protein